MMEKWNVITQFVRDWWRLASPFWKSRERIRTGMYLGMALLCNIINVYMSVRFANWSRDFFNAMEQRDTDAFFYQLGVLFILASISLFLYANQRYFSSKGVLIWRQWLSAYYTERWLLTRRYYEEVFFQQIDNPDQRIAEDLRIFPSRTVSMTLDFIDSLGSLGAFTVILWNLSSAYEVFGVVIPGIMLWLAVGFVIIGTWLVHLIGRPLVDLERETQCREANYRYRLLRVREKAREIAVYGGEKRETDDLCMRFQEVLDVWLRNIVKTRQLNYFMSGYSQISGVVPYLIAAPKYFQGTFGMGELMQTVQAFNAVRVSLSWFILNYPGLTEWKATVDRLTQFDSVLRQKLMGGPTIRLDDIKNVELQSVQLRLPDGTALGCPITYQWKSGRRVAITGPSGVGKSTLVQAMRGVWCFGEGTIVMPKEKVLFLSQTPYLVEGPLLSLLSYPGRDEPDEETGRVILEKLELTPWIPYLCEARKWDAILSPGEQQRIVLGRVWYHHPEWLVMDEALSAVDPVCRQRLYARLRDDFPQMSVWAIEHDLPEVDFYDELVSWEQLQA